MFGRTPGSSSGNASSNIAGARRVSGALGLICLLPACQLYDAGELEPPETKNSSATGSIADGGADASADTGADADVGRASGAMDAAARASDPLSDDDDAGWTPPETEFDEPPGQDLPDRKRVTIDSGFVDEDLVDFPVLVRLFADRDLARARADGRSLFFTAADGESVLDADFEVDDLASGSVTAWVRLPVVSSASDSVFYLYWDDGRDHSGQFSAAGVWRAGYEGVYHLEGGGRDASPFGRHGRDQGTRAASGQLRGARHFEGGAYIALGGPALPSDGRLTITAWVRPRAESCHDFCAIVASGGDVPPYPGVALYLAGSLALGAMPGAVGTWESTDNPLDSWHFSELVVAPDGWTYVALTTQADEHEGWAAASIAGRPWTTFYRPDDGDTTGFRAPADARASIGRIESADGFYHAFTGDIDELRVASTARSNAWLRAEYENQRDDSTFLRVATEKR